MPSTKPPSTKTHAFDRAALEPISPDSVVEEAGN